jgi:hypothetical protein
MGRIYWDPDQGGRPNPLEVDAAAVREGVAAAEAATQTTQQQAGRFYTEFGSDVLPGHAPVGSPGDIGSDPDSYGPDASDTRG